MLDDGVGVVEGGFWVGGGGGNVGSVTGGVVPAAGKVVGLDCFVSLGTWG